MASIDAVAVKGGYCCAIADGSDMVDKTPVELAREAERLGTVEISINSVHRDGMMQGYDVNYVRSIVETIRIPVTAVGGAGGISDLKKVLAEGHMHAVAGGSMFVYYGRLKAVLITVPSEEELAEAGVYGYEGIPVERELQI